MPYIEHILIYCLLYSIYVMSLNLLVGYTGLLSVTHIMFGGLGAYTTAILMTRAHWNFFLALPIAVLVAMAIGLLISLVFSKFRDDYYALATVGFNIIMVSVLRNWTSLTRGPLGIPGVPRASIFGFTFSSPLSFLVLVLVVASLVYVFCEVLVRSSFGRVLQAIRDDEKAAEVFGYNAYYFKLVIFVIAAGLGGLVSSFTATYLGYIDPNLYVLLESIMLLSTVILGGLASQKGAVIGAFVIVLLPEALRFVGFPSEVAAQMRQLVFGLLLVLLMLYRPQGILGKYKL